MNRIKLAKAWNIIENLFFAGFAISILWITVNSFFDGTWKSLSGGGFLKDVTDPVNKKTYYLAAISILSVLTTFFLLTEIVRLFYSHNPFRNFEKKSTTFKKELSLLKGSKRINYILSSIGNTQFIEEVFRRYKT